MHGFLTAWVPLLVAVDPIGTLPVYLTFGLKLDERARMRMYIQAVAYSAIVALLFVFVGKGMFTLLGIEPAAFKVAGGALLFLIAFNEMIWSRPSRYPSSNPALVPLAIPMTMGPAAITTTLVLVEKHGPTVTLAALFATLSCLLLTLLVSRYILKLVSIDTLQAIGKLIYLLLAAIGVQFIHSGIMQLLDPALN